MPFCHIQGLSRRNLSNLDIILPRVILSFLIPPSRFGIRHCIAGLTAILVLQIGFSLRATAGPDPDSAAEAKINAQVRGTIVIGIVGGFVSPDNAKRREVKLARHLRSEYPGTLQVKLFDNRHRSDARKLILRVLGNDHGGIPTEDEKQSARIVLYGHSWGASAIVSLARELKAEGIPVLLTVQVDSVAKPGQNDALIPSNVVRAVNFYQPHGFIHGRAEIRAADPSRTQILGNYRVDYSANPISCPEYPWYDNFFMRSHTEIGCDPKVWDRVESLIREQLPAPVETSSR
jgi:hypothetical protein